MLENESGNISLKRVKMEEKLLWTAYRNSPTHFLAVTSEQKPIKFWGKVAVGVVRESRKFSGHPYIGRIALHVVFVIAQLSCFNLVTENDRRST